MMAVVLLTENAQHSIVHQVITATLMVLVIEIVYVLMRGALHISRLIGDGGTSIISRVMGMVLASITAANVLEGTKEYFQ
jgi:multiple antibiotic resistance protein